MWLTSTTLKGSWFYATDDKLNQQITCRKGYIVLGYVKNEDYLGFIELLKNGVNPVLSEEIKGLEKGYSPFGWGGFGIQEEKIDLHGIEIIGLSKASQLSANLKKGFRLQLMYNFMTRELTVDRVGMKCYYTYKEKHLLSLGFTDSPISMQEIADKVRNVLDETSSLIDEMEEICNARALC